MSFEVKLNIIAEKINDSIPSTHDLFELGLTDEIINLAKEQAREGGKYIDVNIGMRDPKLMEELVYAIQSAVSIPLSIDTPSFEIAERALKAYDPQKAKGEKPILNSIGSQRLQMFDLLGIQPFKVILMSNERYLDGRHIMNRNAEEVVESAHRMFAIAKKHNIPNDDIIFDPSIAPIATDHQGFTKMTVEGIRLIGREKNLQGCHMSVGLSNFTVMLPGKTRSGAPVKLPLENAFLKLAIPNGLDYIVGNTRKKYELLSEEDPAMQIMNEVIAHDDMTVLNLVRKFYNT